MVRICTAGTSRISDEEVELKRMKEDEDKEYEGYYKETKKRKFCCCGTIEGTLTSLYRDSEHHVEDQFDVFKIQTHLREVSEFMLFRLSDVDTNQHFK